MQLFGATRAKTENKTTADASALASKRQGHVIVTGNEKGGSGKTTTTMHLIIALLRLGFKVGTIDIDSRQRTLSRYMENRKHTIRNQEVKLPESTHLVIQRSPFNIVEDAERDECERFTAGVERMAAENDFVVVDSPGNDTYLSRLAHSYADTVITPINDSFVDLDVLATVDGNTMRVIRPSIYSEMVWEQKLNRAKRDGGTIEWIVMRNRLTTIDAKNKRYMSKVLTELSRRIGFRVAPGFSERVIYRELFLQGLTVLDIMDMSKNVSISMSHVTARQEVRDLLKCLQVAKIDERVHELRTRPEEKKTKPSAKSTKDAAPKKEPSKASNATAAPKAEAVIAAEKTAEKVAFAANKTRSQIASIKKSKRSAAAVKAQDSADSKVSAIDSIKQGLSAETGRVLSAGIAQTQSATLESLKRFDANQTTQSPEKLSATAG